MNAAHPAGRRRLLFTLAYLALLALAFLAALEPGRDAAPGTITLSRAEVVASDVTR